jgi:hypothetical protein
MNADTGPYMRLSDWEIRGLQRQYREAQGIRRGQKRAAYRSIAASYGINLRTFYRYATAELYEVRAGEYRATFAVASAAPTRVSAWEKAA